MAQRPLVSRAEHILGARHAFLSIRYATNSLLFSSVLSCCRSAASLSHPQYLYISSCLLSHLCSARAAYVVIITHVHTVSQLYP